MFREGEAARVYIVLDYVKPKAAKGRTGAGEGRIRGPYRTGADAKAVKERGNWGPRRHGCCAPASPSPRAPGALSDA